MFRFPILLALTAALLFPEMPTGRATQPDASSALSPGLSTLGQPPNWRELEKYQRTITHDEFVHLVNDVYCTRGIGNNLLQIESDRAKVLTKKGSTDYFVLHFAASAAEVLPVRHRWKAPSALPASSPAGPLSGFHIALDPGHLGGSWAKMEERWFQIGNSAPVEEGDLTLRVAQIVAPRLQSLGATVSLVRYKPEPVTRKRPPDFEALARQILQQDGINKPREKFTQPNDPLKEETVEWQRELLFYRTSEIRARAAIVNRLLQPDLVLCLHFNAERWGDPTHPTLVPENHLHLLVNGAYLPTELELDDQRFEMLRKLLSRAYPEELAIAETVAQSMARTTGLPPYHYTTENVTLVGSSGYVYARNLMATRLYHCPTVYLEPYVMNSEEVFARVEAGDYDGERVVAGKKRASIFREYAEGVVEGLVSYFKTVRAEQ